MINGPRCDDDFTRRTFLYTGGAAALAGLALAGCDLSTDPSTPSGSTTRSNRRSTSMSSASCSWSSYR